VWEAVDETLVRSRTDSGTASLSDAFTQHEADMAEWRKHLAYVAGANGLAIAIGKRVVLVDLFDKPETAQALWESILSGCILEAMFGRGEDVASRGAVTQLLQSSSAADWTKTETSVGEGIEFRTEFAGEFGSSLLCGDNLVHASIAASTN
jgi:hypothetical protein